MQTATTRTMHDEDGQYVLLPPEMEFGANVELTIMRFGEVVTIYPTRNENPNLPQDAIG
ncbi:MAG: hypothetical protein ACXW3D_03720 [Caulobacteraceae bacterium]